jgi:hypothetical protein
MTDNYDLQGMVSRVLTLRATAAELKSISGGIQAVDRNVDRILASVKMLEINLVDVADLADPPPSAG